MPPVIHEHFAARRARSVGLLALVAIAFVAGCGPFGYLTKVSRDATRAVADAEAAGAEEYAPYEYWGAVAYLEQAKVLMAYSEYERSFDYGTRAKQLAEEAKKKADRREAGKDRETLDESNEDSSQVGGAK
jgi:hypothetical protein